MWGEVFLWAQELPAEVRVRPGYFSSPSFFVETASQHGAVLNCTRAIQIYMCVEYSENFVLKNSCIMKYKYKYTSAFHI